MSPRVDSYEGQPQRHTGMTLSGEQGFEASEPNRSRSETHSDSVNMASIYTESPSDSLAMELTIGAF
jgi:hypothetical protein